MTANRTPAPSTTHTDTCRHNTQCSILENARDAGEDVDVSPTGESIVWGVPLESLIDSYLEDGTSTCICGATGTGPRYCLCGCGMELLTKANYRPGHDAKHASIVAYNLFVHMRIGLTIHQAQAESELFAELPTPDLRNKATRSAHRLLEKAQAKDRREAELNRRDAAVEAKALADHDAWVNTHCYHCGRELSTPLDQIDDSNSTTANPEHEECFR